MESNHACAGGALCSSTLRSSHSPQGRPLSQSESGGGAYSRPFRGEGTLQLPGRRPPNLPRVVLVPQRPPLASPHPAPLPSVSEQQRSSPPLPVPHGSPNNRILRKPCPFWKLPLVLVVGFPLGPTARQGCALLPWSSSLQGEASVLSARGSLAQPVLKQTSAEHVRTVTEKDASLLQPC